jgi:hypothetical protein
MNSRMFKKVFISVFVGLMIYFLAVNFNDNSDPASYFTTKLQHSKEAPLCKEAAMEIAQREVESCANTLQNDKWTLESTVVEAFPIFFDGIEGVSYYECKVMTNGEAAGYVLVNVNKTDLLIPESSPEGLTLTERYRKQLGRDDFMVLRYDWFRSVAVQKYSSSFNPRRKIFASMGFGDTANFDRPERTPILKKDSPIDVFEDFRTAVLAKGCFPIYSNAELQEYYKEFQPGEYTIGWGNTAWAAKYREIKAELTRTFPCGWHTPQWSQFYHNGYPIGCGNTAWAIVYAYWAAFKGKTKLFKGHDVRNNDKCGDRDDEKIKQCMIDCNRYCETRDVKVGDKKWGRTMPENMGNGIRYAKVWGYMQSSCGRDRGTEFSKFDKVKRHLDADKPAILLIHNDGIGIPYHYVVIEAAVKKQKRIAGKWRDRDVKYLINFGHCATYKEKNGKEQQGRRWIYVREVGVNTHKVYSAFSVFLPTVG